MIGINYEYEEELPIGSIIAILSTFSDKISNNWLLCDGSTINKPDSVLNGKVLPDLTNKLLRGNTTSGGTGGSNDVHTHNFDDWYGDGGNYTGTYVAGKNSMVVSDEEHQPPYIEVQFYMRVS